jgi:hypothetical protein
MNDSVLEDVEKQEDAVAKSLGLTEEDYQTYGSPAEIFEELLYPVLSNSQEDALFDPAYRNPQK